ncbi:MAG: NUDIX domain-containing protein [Betaproteobacteria bacterium]|nr:NUDIX domain-containing protein [Betaproteobacteria bacterium]
MAECVGIPTGVHVLCEREGRVLLLRRAETGFFDGLYSLPGGHVEQGESILQAAARELEEETGLQIEYGDLGWLGVIHRRSDTNRIDFFLRALRWQGEPTLRESNKCSDIGWFARNNLPEKIVPYVKAALETRECAGQCGWMRELGW